MTLWGGGGEGLQYSGLYFKCFLLGERSVTPRAFLLCRLFSLFSMPPCSSNTSSLSKQGAPASLPSASSSGAPSGPHTDLPKPSSASARYRFFAFVAPALLSEGAAAEARQKLSSVLDALMTNKNDPSDSALDCTVLLLGPSMRLVRLPEGHERSKSKAVESLASVQDNEVRLRVCMCFSQPGRLKNSVKRTLLSYVEKLLEEPLRTTVVAAVDSTLTRSSQEELAALHSQSQAVQVHWSPALQVLGQTNLQEYIRRSLLRSNHHTTVALTHSLMRCDSVGPPPSAIRPPPPPLALTFGGSAESAQPVPPTQPDVSPNQPSTQRAPAPNRHLQRLQEILSVPTDVTAEAAAAAAQQILNEVGALATQLADVEANLQMYKEQEAQQEQARTAYTLSPNPHPITQPSPYHPPRPADDELIDLMGAGKGIAGGMPCR